MNRKQKSRSIKEDAIEETFILRHQRKWPVKKIARHMDVSCRTIYRWLALYQDNDSRYWKGTRGTRNRSRKYGEGVTTRIKELKEEVPDRTAVTIHRHLKRELGLHSPSCSHVRRTLRALGYHKGKPRKRRSYVKFQREFPNDLWQIDFKGYEHLGHLGKRYLLGILDDHSRLIIAARWCKVEDGTSVILLLREAFMNHGLPNEIMSDNGSPFKNNKGKTPTRYQRLLERLGVHPHFHTPNHPEAKGKLERLFGTVGTDFLPDARHHVETHPSLDLEGFNALFKEWVDWYNNEHEHSGLGRISPAEAYHEHPRRLVKPLEIDIEWDAWIVKVITRKVSKQNVISVEGKKYFIPAGHVGTKVTVHKYHDRLEVLSHESMVCTLPIAANSADLPDNVERKVNKDGYFKYKRRTYKLGMPFRAKIIKVQEAANGKELLIYHDGVLLARLEIDDGKVY